MIACPPDWTLARVCAPEQQRLYLNGYEAGGGLVIVTEMVRPSGFRGVFFGNGSTFAGFAMSPSDPKVSPLHKP